MVAVQYIIECSFLYELFYYVSPWSGVFLTWPESVYEVYLSVSWSACGVPLSLILHCQMDWWVHAMIQVGSEVLSEKKHHIVVFIY